MPRHCSVLGCRSNYDSELKKGKPYLPIFSFPKEPKLRAKWCEVVPLKSEITKNSIVCILHFTENDFTKSTTASSFRPRLKKDAVPTIFVIDPPQYKINKKNVKKLKAICPSLPFPPPVESLEELVELSKQKYESERVESENDSDDDDDSNEDSDSNYGEDGNEDSDKNYEDNNGDDDNNDSDDNSLPHQNPSVEEVETLFILTENSDLKAEFVPETDDKPPSPSSQSDNKRYVTKNMSSQFILKNKRQKLVKKLEMKRLQPTRGAKIGQKNQTKKTKKSRSKSKIRQQQNVKSEQESEDDDNNEDLLFFRSLLPKLKKLNETDKTQFRKSILETINHLTKQKGNYDESKQEQSSNCSPEESEDPDNYSD